MHKDICAICLNNNGTFIKTVCNHEFHKDCLNEWIKYKENCPICRQNLENFDLKNALISVVYDIIWVIKIGILLGYYSTYY
jgi:hypothetical protein